MVAVGIVFVTFKTTIFNNTLKNSTLGTVLPFALLLGNKRLGQFDAFVLNKIALK